MTKILTYVEIDIDFCANIYGSSPCTASTPETGVRKCFNSLGTCQDRDNFVNEPVTLRFAKDTGYLPRDIDCLPYIADISLTPSIISLGENLGQRATLTVSFLDRPHPDTGPGYDKYVDERPYDPFKQGSYWGKFRARQPFLRGRAIRLIRGELGQRIEDMETRHFVMENFDGPTPQGTFQIVGKDVLKLADDDRSQAPVASNGFLLAEIDESAATLTLSPAGIGDLEYPASGVVCLGGNEICSYTRVSDVLTLTRGLLGSVASDHKAEERVQLCLQYSGEDPADIIYDLLVNYANIPDSFTELEAWKIETESFLQRLYTTTITEPTGVAKLVSELIEQAALSVWWDDIGQQIRLSVLRNVAPQATTMVEDVYISESLSCKEQPDKRVSQCWTFYAQRDPTKPISNEDNFKSAVLTIDLAGEENYGGPSIKKIYARWIPEFGRSIASRVNDIHIGRYRTPPRQFSLEFFRGAAPSILPGGAFNLGGRFLQDETGSEVYAPIMITRVDAGEATIKVEAEEALFATLEPVNLFDRIIIIDTNTYNFNLRSIHDTLFPEIVDPYGISLTVFVQPGITVGSKSATQFAFEVGDWVPGVPIKINCYGKIQGKGGKGLSVHSSGVKLTSSAEDGGGALYTRYPVDIEYFSQGRIWGGGGGGGWNYYGSNGRAGGGGSGADPGDGGIRTYNSGSSQSIANPGSETAGGLGEGDKTANKGGDPGLPGDGVAGGTGDTFAPGDAGSAIDGVSYLTQLDSGDIQGPTIN